jgi:hypothetical protein
VTDAGHVMVQNVIHVPLTTESRVQFLVVPCEICEIQSEAETGFSPSLVLFCSVSIISPISGLGELELACWPLVPKFAGFTPGRSRLIFRAKKFLSTPSLGGEVKPSVPCRSFTACKNP